MIRRFSVNFALFSMGLDVVIICISLAIATQVRPALSALPHAALIPEVVPTPWVIYIVFAIEWVAINLLFSVYDGRKNLRAVDEFASLSLAALLATFALAGTLYLSYRMVSRLLFITFIGQTYLLMLVWRGVSRLVDRARQKKPEKKRHVLIIGAGPVGRELQEKINQNPHLGLNVVGFLDDNLEQGLSEADVLGDLTKATQVISELKVDDVIIALPMQAYEKMDPLMGELHRLPLRIWVIPDYFRLALHKAAIEEFAGIPMLDLRAPALSDYQRMVKRAFDVVVTIILLPFLLPLAGIIALAICLESPGPIIFQQQRVGENGRLFGMLKFRTMVANAEAMQCLVEAADAKGNIIHKMADDPRVTRVGRFLRRTSLDELPQFLNVLKGEMSLVGPRPELPYLVDRYEPWQRQRFAVPQGMTGWWQTHGRSDKPMHLNTEDDLYYVQNYSLLLDVYILIKTIGVVLIGKGAF